MVKMLIRTIRHLFYPPWMVRRRFPPPALKKIESVIQASELRHAGEIRFAVESAMDWRSLYSGESSRERGIEVFSELRIWDTEQNSGVLIFLLLADRDVEIIADRGINRHVDSIEWQQICKQMERAFREDRFEEGVILGIQEIGSLLERHFPVRKRDVNELSNKPVIL